MRRRPSPIPTMLVTLVAAALTPGLAQAHLVATGMGPVYDGLVHFALTPEDGLTVTALAFYAGLRGPGVCRRLLGVTPLAWCVGGLFATFSGLVAPPLFPGVAAALSLLILGGLLAADVSLSPRACVAVGVALGAVHGVADLTGAPPDAGGVLNLAGMCAGVFVLFALAASVTLPLKRLWMIVAARVAGSWVAASGLLLAGWIIRFGAGRP